jgi:hypothetical protein
VCRNNAWPGAGRAGRRDLLLEVLEGAGVESWVRGTIPRANAAALGAWVARVGAPIGLRRVHFSGWGTS